MTILGNLLITVFSAFMMTLMIEIPFANASEKIMGFFNEQKNRKYR